MKNCKNKNGLPMKWVMRQPFHGGQYEYYYSDIGMGCHNLELFARIYPTNGSDFHQSDNRLDTVYLPPNHYRHHAVCGTQKQTPARCLPSHGSKVPLAAVRPVETAGAGSHRDVLSFRHCVDGHGRYHLSSYRPKGQWSRMVAGRNTLHRFPPRPLLGAQPCGADPPGNSSLGRRAAGTARQYEIASHKRPRACQTCRANACGSKGLVSSKTVYDLCGRLLRYTGRSRCDIYPSDQPDAMRCGYLRIAREDTKASKRSQSQKGQATANSNSNSFSGKILATRKNLRTRQNKMSAGICQGGNLVQGFSLAGIAGDKPRPRWQS